MFLSSADNYGVTLCVSLDDADHIETNPRCFRRSFTTNRATAIPKPKPPPESSSETVCAGGRCFGNIGDRSIQDVDGKRKLALYRNTAFQLEVRDWNGQVRVTFEAEVEATYAKFTDGAILVTFSAAGPMTESYFHALDGTPIGPVGPPGSDDDMNHYASTSSPVALPGGRLAFFVGSRVAIHERDGTFVKTIDIALPKGSLVSEDDMGGNDGMVVLPDGRLAIVWGSLMMGAVTLVEPATGHKTFLPSLRCPET